jgi:uncharacterized sporulation protein YeaH/YhbH (DUF444 family)
MTRRVKEDRKAFRDVVSGRIRKALKKFIDTGQLFPKRGKNGKFFFTIPRINVPHFVHGSTGTGVSRGKGKKGDIIGRDKGDDKGDQAGEGESEGVMISVDMEEILQFLQDELQLPNLKPKESDRFDEVRIKYNSLSLSGPNSLRHIRKTLQQAMRRQAATGELHELHEIPGLNQPVRLITPINSDFRYRQYTEVKKRSSNAVIFFARDGSGSMNQDKCDIVSDMAWWIDVWIRRFYERVERCYIWHDWVAQEVDEEKFYKYRYGGGTSCSSAMKLIAKQFENRFTPDKWNIYVFYFTDGDNWGDPNDEAFCGTIKKYMGPDVVNFMGMTQIMCHRYSTSLKKSVDDWIKDGRLKEGHIRTTSIGSDEAADYYTSQLSPSERNEQMKRAVKDLLGKQRPTAKVASEGEGI